MSKTETKHEKFKRLAETRTNKALKSIELLENLANTSNYDYTREDYRKILTALRNALNNLEAAFKKSEKGGVR